jgi:UDP-N-acetylglucosamine 4,6-dehydratase
LYGLSKAVAEAYAVQANSYTVPAGTRVVVIRYGNVLASRGSVLQTWARQHAAGEALTVTDPMMTRFWLTLDQAVRLVRHAATVDVLGGEVFVPRLRVASLEALARAFAPGHPVKMIGVRPGGEKRHEQLLTDDEGPRTYEGDGGYVVTPAAFSWTTGDAWRECLRASAVPADFRYESGSAPTFSDQELAALMAEANGAPG